MLSQSAKTLIQRRRHMRLMDLVIGTLLLTKSLTHTVTPVIGTTQRSTKLFVGNSIPTNSKQRKCVASVAVVKLKKVFPLPRNISEKTLLQVSIFHKTSATLATR